MYFDHQYESALEKVLREGHTKTDRTGTGTTSLFGLQLRYDLEKFFPLITSKRVFWRGVVEELLWLVSGDTNSRTLEAKGVNIWREWSDPKTGALGPVYGHQWRKWGARAEQVRQPVPQLQADLEPAVLGIASTSGINRQSNPLHVKLMNTWRSMLTRCYDPTHDAYPYYGARGVSVCDRWLNLRNFIEDAQKLDGWGDKVDDWDRYQIDKDIVGNGFLYGPDTCVWVTREENMRAKYALRHYLVHESGQTAVIDHPSDFYSQNGIAQGNFCAMLRGERPVAGGWSLQKTEEKNAGIDQISRVIESLKTNPDSRRHIVSAWNPTDEGLMALPPCHALFQFYVADGKLSCQLYQRSADMFLGTPFNLASYALLTRMMAFECGLRPGEFIWTGGDCHIYSNHVEQVQEQLSRKPRAMPQLNIVGAPDDFFSYRFEDFNIDGYDPHPSIKAPVAV